MASRHDEKPTELKPASLEDEVFADLASNGVYLEKTFGRFSVLFVALLTLAFLYTFFEMYRIHPWMDAILITVVMATGLYALRDTQHPLKLATAAIIPALTLTWIYRFGGSAAFDISGNISVAAFYAIVAVSIVMMVTRSREVTADGLFGAVSVYLLFGIIWAHLFMVVAQLNPHAFQGDFGPDRFAGFIYYSFSTLTTLGLGDLQPISAQARALSILEVIFGNLYLAVLVSRLVALQISSHEPRRRAHGRDRDRS